MSLPNAIEAGGGVPDVPSALTRRSWNRTAKPGRPNHPRLTNVTSAGPSVSWLSCSVTDGRPARTVRSPKGVSNDTEPVGPSQNVVGAPVTPTPATQLDPAAPPVPDSAM
jgi:hypothetical protein